MALNVILSGWGNKNYAGALKAILIFEEVEVKCLINSSISSEINNILESHAIPGLSWENLIRQSSAEYTHEKYTDRLTALDMHIILKLYLRTIYAFNSINSFFIYTENLASRYYRLIASAQPKLVLWPDVPHAYGDYILAAVAKNLGINNIVVKPTGTQGWKLARLIDLNNLTHIACRDCQMSSSKVLARLADQFHLSRNLLSRPYDQEKLNNQILKRRHSKQEYMNYVYHNNGVDCLKNTIKLKQYVQKYESTDDILPTDILVFLHYEPEASLCPLGGYYSDQLLFVRRISEWATENGASIYIREHPDQLQIPLSGLSANLHWVDNLSLYPRNDEFLASVLSLPCVRGFKNKHSVQQIFSSITAPSIASVNGNVLLQARIEGLHTVFAFKPWFLTSGMTHVDDLAGPLKRPGPLNQDDFIHSSSDNVLDADFMETGEPEGIVLLFKKLNSWIA
jgi:hypothetical protein